MYPERLINTNKWTIGSQLSEQLHQMNTSSLSRIRISKNSIGKCAYALERIDSGTTLCAFMGVVSSSKYHPADFSIPCYLNAEKLMLHCRVKQSPAHYFNHDCKNANCAIVITNQVLKEKEMYTPEVTVEWPKIQTTRVIDADEELTLNYGMGKKDSIVHHHTQNSKTKMCLCKSCEALPKNQRNRF